MQGENECTMAVVYQTKEGMQAEVTPKMQDADKYTGYIATDGDFTRRAPPRGIGGEH